MRGMQKKRKPVLLGRRLLNVTGGLLCVILIPLLIMNCTLIVKSYMHQDQVPGIGGIFPMIILTDSMYPEFASGDLILCGSADAEEIQAGDIICFYDPAGNGTTTVTHRVKSITTDEDGNLAWTTKGDANNAEDEQIVPAKNLVGVYQKNIRGLGKAAIFMQTTRGLMICVICPVILLAVYDMIRRGIYERSRKRDTEALMEELQELRADKERRTIFEKE